MNIRRIISFIFCIFCTFPTANADDTSLLAEEARSLFISGSYADAYELALPLAKQGNALAMRLVGEAMMGGDGTRRNPKEGSKFLIDAANLGDGTAAYIVGEMYFRGIFFEKDLSLSKKYFEIAASNGRLDAAIPLTVLTEGTEEEQRWRDLYFESASFGELPTAEEQNDDLMNALDLIYQKKYDEADAILNKLANYGLVLAMYNLGLLNRDEKILGSTKEQAIYWFERAAKLGHLESILELAEYAETDRNNKALAVEYHHFLSDKGDALSHIWLAHHYLENILTPEYKKSLEDLFSKSSIEISSAIFDRDWSYGSKLAKIVPNGVMPSPQLLNQFRKIQNDAKNNNEEIPSNEEILKAESEIPVQLWDLEDCLIFQWIIDIGIHYKALQEADIVHCAKVAEKIGEINVMIATEHEEFVLLSNSNSKQNVIIQVGMKNGKCIDLTDMKVTDTFEYRTVTEIDHCDEEEYKTSEETIMYAENPYVAYFNCELYGNRLPLAICLESSYITLVNRSMSLTYNISNWFQLGVQTPMGLQTVLTPRFQIEGWNSSRDAILSVTIRDRITNRILGQSTAPYKNRISIYN